MNFKDKVQSMTAKEIIMSMVEGLRDPKIKINMISFGYIKDDICYGCAATNTICQISNKTFNKDNIIDLQVRSNFLETDITFLNYFENAIDNLRSEGYLGIGINLYNAYAKIINIALIKRKPKLNLPYLSSDYTEEDLQPYVELAEYQDN